MSNRGNVQDHGRFRSRRRLRFKRNLQCLLNTAANRKKACGYRMSSATTAVAFNGVKTRIAKKALSQQKNPMTAIHRFFRDVFFCGCTNGSP